MKKIIAILFLSLMLLQAVPVLHFMSSHKGDFYSLIDEEKSVEKCNFEKKEGKEFLSLSTFDLPETVVIRCFGFFTLAAYASPSLDALTPPPNA